MYLETTVYTYYLVIDGMVNWSFDSDGSDLNGDGLSLVKPRSRRRLSRRKMSRSTRSKSIALSNEARVQKVINGQVTSLRVRRVMRS